MPWIRLEVFVAGVRLVLVIHRHAIDADEILVRDQGSGDGIIDEDGFLAAGSHGIGSPGKDLDALRQARRFPAAPERRAQRRHGSSAEVKRERGSGRHVATMATFLRPHKKRWGDWISRVTSQPANSQRGFEGVFGTLFAELGDLATLIEWQIRARRDVLAAKVVDGGVGPIRLDEHAG